MCNSEHLIKLQFAESHATSLGGVIEATGLFVNAFVEGNVLHDRSYVLSIDASRQRLLSSMPSYDIR